MAVCAPSSVDERPRERLRRLGPAALRDQELLAIIIGTGTRGADAAEVARRLLLRVGGVEQLARRGMGDLSSIPGVGEAKAARVAAAVELGVRLVERSAARPSAALRFECSADIHRAFGPRLSLLQQEVFYAVGLNSRNDVIRQIPVAVGGVAQCPVQPREVFRPLIAEAAVRAVLMHNHPSGDPTPSPHDVALTRRLVRIGDLVGIPVLDHVIIGRGAYSSLRDLGFIGAAAPPLEVDRSAERQHD